MNATSWDKQTHCIFSPLTVHTCYDESDEMTTSPAASDVRRVCSLIPIETQESHFIFSRITKLLVRAATDFSFLLQKSPLHSSTTSWYQYLHYQVLCSSAVSVISHRFTNCGTQKNHKNQPI